MAYNPQNPNGQATGADSAPVVIASDQSAIPVNIENEPTVTIGATVAVSAANLPLPSGAATAAGQTGGGAKTQVVDGSGNIVGTTANALDVFIAGTPTVSISGTPSVSVSGTAAVSAAALPLPAGAASSSNQTGGSQKTQLVDGSGNVIGSTSNALDVAVTGTPTVAISGTPAVTVSGTTAENLAQVGGTTVATGNGATTAGTQRVTLSSDSTGQVALAAGSAVVGGVELVDSGGSNKAAISPAGRVSVDGSGVTQPVSGTVTANLAAGSANVGAFELLDSGGSNKLSVNASGQAAVAPAGGDLTSGSQLAKLYDGTNSANVQSGRAGWNALTIVNGTQEQTSLTAGSLNAMLVPATDVTGFAQASLEVTGAFSGTLTVQGSNDNATFTSVLVLSTAAGAGTMVNTITATGLYIIPLWYRYLRVTMTAYTSGTANGTLELYGTPRGSTSGVSAAQSGSWTVQPGNTPNTTPWLASLQPATAGGWSISSQTALSATVVAAKATAGQLGGHCLYNPNASAAYIQVFNATTSNVTLGTTTPTLVIPAPATTAIDTEWTNGVAFAAAISYAATTTPTGSIAPAASLTGFLLYK